MIRFKNFILEQKESDDIDFAIRLAETIDSKIVEINAETQFVSSNSKRITISQLVDASKRDKFVNSANEEISNDEKLSLVSVPPSRVKKDYAFKHEDVEKTIYVATKPSGKNAAPDPNELMTAGMVVLPNLSVPTTVEEMDALIENASNAAKSKVKDYKKEEIEVFEKDYTNSAQAISAAIAIRSVIGGPADVAYMTGKKWNKDIEKFKRNSHGMKDFNSSDIVFKKGKNWYGISLKKKESSNAADPTLLNKAFNSIINDEAYDDLREQVSNKTDEFFVGIIKKAMKEGIIPKERVDEKNWKKFMGSIDNKYVNENLKGKESLFKDIADVVEKNSEKIANAIIQLSLKLDLKDLKKEDFNFFLVTGIGSYGPRKGISVEDADLKDIDTLTEKMDRLFTKGEPKFLLDRRKTQAFQKGAKAAKLFFVLRVGGMNVIESEIRYKGSFTAQPQFFASMTDEFKKYLKEK